MESQNAINATNYQTHDFKLPNKSNFIQTLNSIQHSEGLSNFNVEQEYAKYVQKVVRDELSQTYKYKLDRDLFHRERSG